ncbi:alpha/beta hydrolase [Ramlibacter sp. AW1]|uniref:Alpha/beta hydrolase n=1 Tax=Ramlibacter aurantiacus TaxID=2801330 RepID=A0A937D6Z9_9BURK|nr:alpha/beta hydrolase [Ramlibacter aurantiacus]MBL0420411.1 alpha/beta hydrolase [Ramlibacter aurantiacus]
MPFPAAERYACTVMDWSRQVPLDGLHVQRDVSYGPHRLQRYDVIAPAQVRDAPVVVVWHGGGWTNGYRQYNHFMAPILTRMGCVMISPSYRLVDQARLPAAFTDSMDLLAHLASHVHAYGGDAQAMFLSGHSAGGHLAALATLRGPDSRRGETPQGRIRACLPISGIMDLQHPAPPAGSLEERVYTRVLERPELDAVLSPICWAAGNRVPFSLWVGEHDSERVRRSNTRLHELLALQPGGSELHVMPGRDHFETHLSLRDPQHPWYTRLARCIGEYR